MKKSEFNCLIDKIYRDVLSEKQDLIKNRVSEIFQPKDGNSIISTNQAIASATALSLTLATELSATITKRMLVELGLVALETEE